MKKIFIFLFICILISGCTKTKIQPVTYQEVNKFIADNYLQALDFKLVGDIAIILFEDEVRTGYYLLYKNEDNTLKSKLAFGLSDSTQPVIIYASSSAIPFVSLIIKDNDLLESAHSVEIVLENQTTIKDQISNKGIIIPYDKQDFTSYSNVIIYDEYGKMIYSHN